MQHTLPCALLALAAPVAGALPQGPDPLFPTPATLDYTRPLAPQGTDPYTRGHAGDFDGDSLADIVHLHGDQVEVVFAPGLYMSLWDDVVTANDVAVLEFGAPDADSILTVGSAGLREHELTWSGSTPLWLTGTLEPGWAGALRVASRTLPGGGGSPSWIFGLQSDSRTVRARAKGANTTWMEGLLFATDFDVTEILPVNFAGDAGLELAVMGEHRLEVWGTTGLPFDPWVRLLTVAYPQADLIDMASGSQDGGSHEWVALLGAPTAAPADSVLILRDMTGGYPQVTISGSPDAAGIAAGDFDDDGSDDLVLSIRSSFDALVALNEGGAAPAFNGTRGGSSAPTRDIPIPDVSGLPSGAQAQPIVADLDNDDRDNFCYAIQATDSLFVHRDRLEGPPVQGPGFTLDPGQFGELELHDEDYQGPFGCSISEVLLPTDAPSFPGSAELIESHLWIRRASDAYTDPDTINYLGLEQSGVRYDLDLELETNPGDLPGAGAGRDDTLYYILLCFAERDSMGNVTRILRPRLYGFQSHCDPSDVPSCSQRDLLLGLSNGDEFSAAGIPCEDPGTINPGIWIGTGVPLPCLPELPPASPPRLKRMSL